ncbi:MAG: 5'-methylthioadenosine/S-adenosylhomocysteine nucleosidase, partial [Saezia sp.]
QMFEADAQLMALTEQAVGEVTHLRAVEGVIASGDMFMSDPVQIALLRERFPQAIAVDMEAAAIAHTCHLYGTPFVVIRAISDVVTKPENHVDFFSFLPKAAANSAKVVERVVALLK